LRAKSILEMVDMLVAQGVKQKDIAIAQAGDGAMDEEMRSSFRSCWESEWRRLGQVEREMNDLIRDWVEDWKLYKYLRSFQEQDARKLEQAKVLLGVWMPVWGIRVYPAFQFEGLMVKQKMRELLGLLPEDPNGWAQVRWLGASHSYLGNRRPIDVARDDLNAVVQETERYFLAGYRSCGGVR
jgi:hypothetical protein